MSISVIESAYKAEKKHNSPEVTIAIRNSWFLQKLHYAFTKSKHCRGTLYKAI
jgi:hypothetical protein